MSELVVPIIVISVIAGLCTRWVAKEKGLNPTKWFFAGMVFSVFALAAVLLRQRRKPNV